MEKEKKLLFSPLFLKYQADFEKNPKSRVFAPLAEIYRKVGMTEKAMEILSHGIRFHPGYVMAYLGLAFCYFDLRQYNLAYTTLRPFVEENRDNLRLQKLFSDVCLAISKKEEALETLKYLLFLNPRDKEIALSVTQLEQEMEGATILKHKPIIIPEETLEEKAPLDSSFHVEKLESTPREDFDDWMTLNLGIGTEEKKVLEVERAPSKIEWHMEQLEPAPSVSPVESDHSPVITHTLVDLYCSQGHLEKALEILEKILILNPHDERTIAKKNEILALVSPQETPVLPKEKTEEKTEEEGRKELMDLIDERVHIAEVTPITPIEVSAPEEKRDLGILEDKYQTFLKKIQKRALDYQARF